MKKGLYLTLDIKLLTCVSASLFATVVIVICFAANRTVAVSNFSQLSKPVIIIDAGHGGEDGGTQSESGILEKDINLSIAKKTEKILTRYGFTVVTVRDEDKLIYDDTAKTIREKKSSDLHNRMDIMKKYPGCIFLSIHQNHFSESKYSGAQVFYCEQKSESLILADSIQKSIVNSLQKENTRQIKPCTSSVYLIYNAVTTAVMVECGFLSNRYEAEKLSDNTYQYEMALAIAKGLVNFVQTKGS